MLKNVFQKTLRDQRWSLLYWSIGLITLAVIYVVIYPSIAGMESIVQYLQELPEGLMEMFTGGEITDYSSPVGYFNTELFSFMAPLLFLIFSIGFGTGAIAGEEEKGTLDFLLSSPVPRWRVVAEKFGVMVVSMTLLAFVFWVGLAVSIIIVDVDLELTRLAEAILGTLVLGLVFGAFSLWIGCLKGSRGLCYGISGGLAVLTYLLYALGSIVNELKDYRFLSPFYHFLEPNILKNGIDPIHMLVLVGLAVLFFLLSIPAFTRRDIGV